MSLVYYGHLFDSCTCIEDVQKVKVDPTGTGPIRARFTSAINIRWRKVRVMVRQALVVQNLLGLGNAATPTVAISAMIGGVNQLSMFQRWIDTVLAGSITGSDGSFVRPYIQAGYDAGVVFAHGEVGTVVPPSTQDRVGTLSALAHVELQGICEAVSQQAVRAVAGALLTGTSASKLVRQIQAIIDSVGVVRSTAMVELLVVKAFGEATLDTYSAAGVSQVGLVAESRIKRVGDAKTGPGSRSSRSTTPSRSTIGRIARVEGLLSGLGRVNVETAEDDNVCPVCEDIADEGPYTINRARQLIPAHPRCRCIFVPVIEDELE